MEDGLQTREIHVSELKVHHQLHLNNQVVSRYTTRHGSICLHCDLLSRRMKAECSAYG